MNFEHIKNDFKQLFREPAMVLLFFMPIFIFLLFKIIITVIIPKFNQYIPFQISDYYSYVLAFTFILIPGMLSIVSGFMMLDERDGNISELMSVTPLGRNGYLYNRLSFSFIATILYTFIGYFVLNIYDLPLFSLFFLAILLGVFSMTVSLILFVLAPDKVRGLTYAKGLNILMLFTLTDLLDIQWLIWFSKLIPTYWVTQIIHQPSKYTIFAIALVVHVIWLISILLIDHRKATI